MRRRFSASVKLDFVFVGEAGPPAGSAGRGDASATARGRHVDGWRTALKDAEDEHTVEGAENPGADLQRVCRRNTAAHRFLSPAGNGSDLPALKEIEADLRDRFGKFGDEIRALLLMTENPHPGGTKKALFPSKPNPTG